MIRLNIYKTMWQKIKLIRKAFITNFIGVHYSQFGEDIVLRELLKKEYKKKAFLLMLTAIMRKNFLTYICCTREDRKINKRCWA